MKSNNAEMMEAVVPAILKHWPEAVAIYLFGSYATANERGESDVDLALMLPHESRVTNTELTCARMPSH